MQAVKYEIQQIVYDRSTGEFKGIKSAKETKQIQEWIGVLDAYVDLWNSHPIFAAHDCTLRPLNQPFDAEWTAKIENNPYNQDLRRVITLCAEKNFREASKILDKYPIGQKDRELHKRSWVFYRCYFKANPFGKALIRGILEFRDKWRSDQSKKHLGAERVKNLVESSERLKNDAEAWKSLDKNSRLNNRLDALNESVEEGEFAFKQYELNEHGKALMGNYAETKTAWISHCNGNKMQHVLHAEQLQILDKTGALFSGYRSSEEITELTQTIVTFTTISSLFNKTGSVDKACAVNDFCWALLDCGLAAVEGVAQGVENIGNAIIHPIDTVTSLGDATINAGYCLGKVMYVVMVEPEHVSQEELKRLWDNRANRVCNFASALLEKASTMRPRDVIKEVSTIVTEGIITGHLMSATGTFLKAVDNKSAKFIQKAEKGGEKAILITAEGIPVQAHIAEEGMHNLAHFKKGGSKLGNAPRVNQKIANMKEFFNLEYGKTLKGKVTKFRDDIYRVTEKLDSPFLKKGEYFYLDTKHFDHIEVYNKRGHAIRVINLDGSYNAVKSKVAYLEKRTIDI